MVFLGFGKYVRADRIYAVEPIVDERGSGARTRVWVEGIPEPIDRVAHRARDPGRDGRRASPDAARAAGREPLLSRWSSGLCRPPTRGRSSSCGSPTVRYLERTEPDRDDPDARYTIEGIEGWVTRHDRAFVILEGDGDRRHDQPLQRHRAARTERHDRLLGRRARAPGGGSRRPRSPPSSRSPGATSACIGSRRAHAPTTCASQRVLEKNGFTRVGLLRRHLLIGGEWVDHLLWEKLEDD